MKNQKRINGGVYLVVDPTMDKTLLLLKLDQALQAGIDVVQLWNHWPEAIEKLALIEEVSNLCTPYGVPLLIDNDWELLCSSLKLDGVHFDAIPDNYNSIKDSVKRPFHAGITCSGNLDTVRWADQNGLSYISFCAMYPSPSAGSCDIVMPSTVKQARALTKLPLFVSGGMTPENTRSLLELIPFDGVAVISGIMSATEPSSTVKLYKKALNKPNPTL